MLSQCWVAKICYCRNVDKVKLQNGRAQQEYSNNSEQDFTWNVKFIYVQERLNIFLEKYIPARDPKQCVVRIAKGVEFREPWFLEENKWWKPPWSGISVENYLGVKTHQRTRFKPWWFHEGLPSYMCQWWYQWYLKWFLEIHGPLASPWHADDSFALDGTSLVSRPSLLQKLLFPCNLSKKSL